MSLVNTARWAASVGSRLAMDMAIWTLTKVEKMGEGHLCSKLYTDIKHASTMESIFDNVELSELPKDHIHHDNNTV
tara:strand:+ start:348 stop:575 length:228 start_codon:yes stop_codon:yes gene_type:complete